MTQQKARVIRLLPGGRAEVAVRRRSACAHDCARCAGGCGSLTAQPEVHVTAVNDAQAAPGDTVTLESDTAPVLTAAALLYLAPAVLFLAGYLIAGIGFHAGGGMCAGAGCAGFILGLVPALALDRRRRRRGQIAFHIAAVERGA